MSQPPYHPEDPLHQFEEELHTLVPAETSAGLQDRIFAALADSNAVTAEETAITAPGRTWFGWVPLAAAAAVAMLAVVLFPAPKGADNVVSNAIQGSGVLPSPAAANMNTTDTTAVSWKPVSSDSRLEHVGYDGIRTENRATYRQITTRSMERRTFVDPTDGTVVEVVFPRENIHLVPAVPE